MEIFNAIVSKIRKWISGQDRKRLIENTAILIIIGVIIIIAGSTLFGNKDDRQSDFLPESQQPAGEVLAAANDVQRSNNGTDVLENRLKTLLSQVEGVGKVDVMITYSSAGENVPAYDIKKSTEDTEEKDSEGGTRNVNQEQYESTLAYEESQSGGKTPVILKRIEPEIKGVLVVAEGADNVEVRDRIFSAVSVVLDVPKHKVQVVQRKK